MGVNVSVFSGVVGLFSHDDDSMGVLVGGHCGTTRDFFVVWYVVYNFRRHAVARLLKNMKDDHVMGRL